MTGMSKAETCAFRRVLDKIAEKFGKYAYIELYEDGSGFIGDKLGVEAKWSSLKALGSCLPSWKRH